MSANRGKYAEGKIRDVLKEMEDELLRFTFNRVQDAHSARGVFAAQAADFQWFFDTGKLAGVPVEGGQKAVNYTRNGIIEVKEVEHATRLPHKNYSQDKIARARKRQLAGSEPLVIVCHRQPGTGTQPCWRFVPFDVFLNKEGGSWELSEWPTYSSKELGPMLRQILLTPA